MHVCVHAHMFVKPQYQHTYSTMLPCICVYVHIVAVCSCMYCLVMYIHRSVTSMVATALLLLYILDTAQRWYLLCFQVSR